jgi:hypothetical protein
MVLADADGSVDRESFIASMQEIMLGLLGLGNLSVRQPQEVLASALDKFDVNGDGNIDFAEFEAALALLGVKVTPSGKRVMYKLLDPGNEGLNLSEEALGGNKGHSWKLEKVIDAFAAAMKGQIKRKGLENIFEGLNHSLAGEGSMMDKFQKGLSQLPLDVLEDAMYVLIDGATFLTASNCILRELSGLDSWDDLNASEVAPLFVFMGLSGAYVVRELNKQAVKDLTEDEALLYAQKFKSYGFSRLEFRQLLRQAGATWEEAPLDSERVLDSSMLAQRLSFIVRGGCKLHSAPASAAADSPSVHLSFGGTIGEAEFVNAPDSTSASKRHLDHHAVLEPGTRLVCWDVERLRRHLSLHAGTEHRLNTILLEAASTKLVAAQKASEGAESNTVAADASWCLAPVENQLAHVTRLQRQGRLKIARDILDGALEELIGLIPGEETEELSTWLVRLREAAPESGSSCSQGSADDSDDLTAKSFSNAARALRLRPGQADEKGLGTQGRHGGVSKEASQLRPAVGAAVTKKCLADVQHIAETMQ